MALIASTSSPSCPNDCWTTSLRRLSPATVAVCAVSPHPSLAGAAYPLQPPQGGFPSPCWLGSARRSPAGSGFVNAHHHRTGEHQMPFPSPTNSATLIGKLTRDPELRTVSTSAGDRSVLTLGIAVRKPIKPDQDDTPTADFFDVTVWGPLAETGAAHLTKGRLVGVSARLEPTAWETADGAKRRGMEVIAGAVEFLDRPRRDTDSEQQSQDVPVAA